ncbi:MAG TPA: S24 family peptidase [Candidatus Eisenbacteria bacterium]|nr:S24 family peptidase [Candidatus Eisenbacteria bacterium]
MPTIQFFQPHEGRQFDGPLDLNEHLIRHPTATFFMRAGSDSRDAGVRAGDLLVIDRSLRPTFGSIVIAVRDGDLRIEAFRRPAGDEELELWGVVTHAIRRL